MAKSNAVMTVRKATAGTSIIDIHGEMNAFVENTLTDAYTQASAGGTQIILLNFGDLDYTNGVLFSFNSFPCGPPGLSAKELACRPEVTS